jgi:hypothetical protein
MLNEINGKYWSVTKDMNNGKIKKYMYKVCEKNNNNNIVFRHLQPQNYEQC